MMSCKFVGQVKVLPLDVCVMCYGGGDTNCYLHLRLSWCLVQIVLYLVVMELIHQVLSCTFRLSVLVLVGISRVRLFGGVLI